VIPGLPEGKEFARKKAVCGGALLSSQLIVAGKPKIGSGCGPAQAKSETLSSK
jgi:hypothetical protein